eukprot:TRINITY_DN2481_c0_g1_i1.p1 TRINITY_DN2481_c0_g1~~TRINITY_DN2481_c0_g1_i1.p1  ORF type:complete len:114 (+),score=30.07 TRINITY_DN2481_c0_g1_i1:27-344(+)
MDEFELFAKRAAAAEDLINKLTKRVEALEAGKGGSSSAPSDDYQIKLLQQLRHLRTTLRKDVYEVNQDKKKTEQLVQENDALKKENEALKYRIEILVKSAKEGSK